MFKKISAILAVVLLCVAGAGLAAAATAAEPAKVYGICITSKGAVRVLEAKSLTKSRYGKCKSSERKLLVPSIDGVPKAINGRSAYQIWAAQPGNAGKTEAQFLASLKGADGKDASLPAKVQFKMGATVAVCVKGADVAGIPAYECAPPAS